MLSSNICNLQNNYSIKTWEWFKIYGIIPFKRKSKCQTTAIPDIVPLTTKKKIMLAAKIGLNNYFLNMHNFKMYTIFKTLHNNNS